MSDKEYLSELAGIMADAAINLVGGQGLNFKHQGCSLGNTDEAVRHLRKITEEYNLAVRNCHD